MGLNASELLGAEQIAGVRVNQRGFYLATIGARGGTSGGTIGGGAAGGIGGMIGTTLLARWARKKAQTQAAELPSSSATPQFGKMAFLAATADDLALVGLETRTTAKLASVIARVPRSHVRSVELGEAAPTASKPLTITFADGSVWLLEVGAAVKKHAVRLSALFAPLPT